MRVTRSRFRLTALIVGFATVGSVVCGFQGRTARISRAVAWDGRGTWVKADTHIHTKFSDGSNTVAEMVDRAAAFGCTVVAITDHGDKGSGAGTPAYFAAIADARTAHPGMVILAGLEWNMAPWGGDEHATVLFNPAVEKTLPAFMEQFDDYGRDSEVGRRLHMPALTLDGLRWLAEHATVDGVPPVVIYQHPSRQDARSIENVDDIRAWRAVNDLVIGFAGAPGHQRRGGSYTYMEKPIDRWDPAVARVGDAWDTLLGSNLDLWAADAPSDYHNDSPADLHDFSPGEFSETWLYVPEPTPAGVLQAYRSGRYFGDHGRIVREVELRVTAPGLPRPAGSGETIVVPRRTTVQVELSFKTPAAAWAEGPNQISRVEIIAIEPGNARVAAEGPPSPTGPALTYAMALAGNTGVTFRARGYASLPDGSRLAFYTNPVRVQVGR